MTLPGVVAVVYGVLVLAGGIMGFARARSRASLLTGGPSGLALVLAGLATLWGWVGGPPAAAALTAALALFFGYRFLRSRAFMPGGLMGVLSLAALVVLLLSLGGGR
ncbi:MAG: hypothetical protein HYY85_06490 [Deltaproteobacteria bacterium]|nr:hypothetical protein [Deltaproteobacteria bacterium]